MLDLGYVAFFAVGGYAMALLATKQHWDFWLILPVGIVVAGLSGLDPGGADPAPARRLPGHRHPGLRADHLDHGQQLSASTAAPGHLDHPAPAVDRPRQGVHATASLDGKPYYYLVLAVIFLVVFLVRRLERSRVGRAWMAIREDEDVAELMGVPTYRFRLWAFAIGAAVGGAGGVFFAAQANHIDPARRIVQLPGVDPGRGRGGARRVGQPVRRHPRCLPGGVAARAVPRLRQLPDPGLRRRPGRHDDLPARGAPAVPAPAGRDGRRRSRGRDEHRARCARPSRAISDRRRRHRRRQPSGRRRCCELEQVTVRFGGVVAISELDLTVAEGRDLRPDRPQRGRQDLHASTSSPASTSRPRARSASTGRSLAG